MKINVIHKFLNCNLNDDLAFRYSYNIKLKIQMQCLHEYPITFYNVKCIIFNAAYIPRDWSRKNMKTLLFNK